MPTGTRFLIPLTLTFTNLSLGVIAILSSNIPLSAVLIIIAAFADRMDGKIARKLQCDSELGKQLDSLSDIVSFGIAPAVVMWKAGLSMLGFWAYVLVLIYVMAGTFRLARFNVTNLTGFFMGLPISLAGAVLAIIAMFKPDNIIYIIFIPIFAILMISNIKIKKI